MPFEMDPATNLVEKRKPYSPNRSCERCRALKIRCVPEDATKCQRCCRLHFDCVYALPTTRKPRKRTDAKVAELEKEVRALSSILRKQQNTTTPSTSTPKLSQEADGIDKPSTQTLFDGPSSPQETPSWSLSGTITESSEHDSLPEFDAIKAGIVTEDLATEIFTLFKDQFLPLLPIVAFPADISSNDVRVSRPFLYLAILAAGASRLDPHKGRLLSKRIASAIAEYGMVQGVKSLDLFQAILVTTAWHYPESSFDHLKYHQYAHLAVGMASYVGIERKSILKERKYLSNRSSPSSHSGDAPVPGKAEEEDILDRQRSLVACYLICSGISRSLHRPTMIPYNNWMTQCLENLEKSEFAAGTDKTLVLLVRMQKMMTESSTALGLDDADVLVDLSEPRIQRTLAFYDLELKSCHQKIGLSHSDRMLEFIFLANRIILHEISMYLDHEPEDFHAPFSIERIGRPIQRNGDLSPAHIESLNICWSSAIEALEAFLVLPIESLRCSPVFIFVRVIYCSTVLIKLSESALVSEATTTLFAHTDRRTIINLLTRLIPHMEEIGRGEVCPIACKFSDGLKRMLNWCNRQTRYPAEENLTDDLLEPLRDMALGTRPETHRDSNETHSSAVTSINDGVAENQGSQLHQDIQMLSHFPQDGFHEEVDTSDFMPWNDFDWNFVSHPPFDFTTIPTQFNAQSPLFAVEDHLGLFHDFHELESSENNYSRSS